MAIVQHDLVEKKHWLTREEFVEEWAVAQLMPGPNVINLALILGGRYFGLRGALAALAGMITIPLILVLLLALFYVQFANHPGVIGALRGMSAVSAGLIAATGLKLASTLETNPLGWSLGLGISACCFVMIAFLHWPMVYVLPGVGSLACLLTYRRLRT